MTDYEKLLKRVTESLLLIGVKHNALKSTLTEKQLEQYNNYIIDYIETNREQLKASLSPDKFQELLDAVLK